MAKPSKPLWLIQTNMEGVDTGPMIAEVESQSMEVMTIETRFDRQINFSDYGNDDDCIICYGDIDFVRQVSRRAPFIPGAWCDFRNMKCSTYYSYFGEYLLNKQYAMMPVGDLRRRWKELITMFYPWASVVGNKELFVRPDSGSKPFTGYVIPPGDEHEIELLMQAIGVEELIVVAPKKDITTEWRFVICDKKVVAGCQYLPTECKLADQSIHCNQPSSFRLAQTIADSEWQPDLCYTVDIAESDGQMFLLEINSFSCAGFYDCDIESIVRNASKAAIAEWEDCYV